MEQDKKNVIKLIAVMIIYILLSALGVFNAVGSVLFPILALPFAYYCVRNKMTVLFHIGFHVIISMVIYGITQNIVCILIYFVSVVIPAYIILVLYQQKMALPNRIMYGGLGLAGVIFVFFTVIKYLGMDFEAQFGAALDEMNHELVTTLESVTKLASTAGQSVASVAELEHSIALMKETLSMSVDTFKAFYAAIIVTQIVICFAVMLIIVNALLRRKMSDIPGIGQLLEFRISKVAVLLLVACMLMVDLEGESSGTMLILALNLMSFLANLLEVAGVFGLIALLKRTSINQGLKVLGYIGIALIFIISPYILMFFGCLDAIFNYRKVSIVV